MYAIRSYYGKKVTFVDVRDVFAFKKTHIKGALHMPLELLAEKMTRITSYNVCYTKLLRLWQVKRGCVSQI